MSDGLNSPIDVAAVSAGAAPTPLLTGTDATTLRKGVSIKPTDGDVYLGGAAVTTLTGLSVPQGTERFWEWTDGGNWYVIRSGGSNVDVRVLPQR